MCVLKYNTTSYLKKGGLAMLVFVYDAIFGYKSFFFDGHVLILKERIKALRDVVKIEFDYYNRYMREYLLKCLHPCPIKSK